MNGVAFEAQARFVERDFHYAIMIMESLSAMRLLSKFGRLLAAFALALSGSAAAKPPVKPAPAKASRVRPVLASPAAAAFDSAMRAELERAASKAEKMRQGYEAGAVSRREMEQAETELREWQQRMRSAAGEPRDMSTAETLDRVAVARADWEKAQAQAKRLRDLYEAGAVARNEVEAAEAAAQQAEVYFKLNEELARRIEELARLPRPSLSGTGVAGFTAGTFFFLQDAYQSEFGHPLPVSAFGPTETHEKLGFDHEGRVDIALHPDSSEGRWFIAQLQARQIPFIAFRHAVSGKATGAHIHMGFPSPVVRRTS